VSGGPPARSRRIEPRAAGHPTADAPAEREILLAIGQGQTEAEIAQRLVLSESTVKTHVGRVLEKICARDRIQAVILTYDLGLTHPSGTG
jgi:DNA-binding NarL/FixJ family response regulator